MSIALKNENGDFIYFDVVTQYSQNFPSQVSQHPVDGSGVISDNAIKQNPRITISGMISGADFNTNKPNLIAEDRTWLGVNNVVSITEVATPITVSYDNNPNNLFPDVIGQFFTDSLPEINGINEVREASYNERILLEKLKLFYESKLLLSLYEFDSGVITNQISNLFITNISANESSDGDALTINLTLEKIQISTLVAEEIPEDVRTDLQERNAEQVNRGGQTGSDYTDQAETDLRSLLRTLLDTLTQSNTG